MYAIEMCSFRLEPQLAWDKDTSMEKLPVIELLLLSLCLLISVSLGSGDGHLISTCLASDREALMDFKSGLHDPNDMLSSWRGSNCCEWHGIECDNNTGAVVTLDLHNPYVDSLFESSSGRYAFWNLSGEIRPSLLKLKSLRLLDLSFSTFNSIPIPEFFGSLENLQYLNLSNAGFGGLIPAHLGNLSHLEVLDLHNVPLNELYADNFQWITGLISLQHLVMDGVNLSLVKDWVGALNQLPSIVELHLSSCHLSGHIPSMASLNFTSLAVIDLSDNSFRSKMPDWLVNISSLQYINVSTNNLYGRIPLGLGDLPNLLSLDLGGCCSKLTASCSQLFRKRWEKIQVLDLSINKIHGKLPSTLGNITSLVLLDLSHNAVGAGIPSSIGNLCNLNYFSLSSNNMTGSLPKILKGTKSCPFKNPLPNMQHLDLSYNEIGGKIPYWLGQLESLVDVDLSNNLFEGPIPTSLGSLQNLATLDVAENKLNGTLPESIGQLSGLSTFDVSSNQLNGTLPESIGQLSGLSTFDVSSNQLTGLVCEAFFSKLTKLKKLYLSSNSFIMNLNSNWIPPFQVKELGMGSCNIGPSFPAWLKSQKEIIILDLSNASISNSVPDWFWNSTPRMIFLSLSQNHLSGQIGDKWNNLEMIDLSSNNFTGRIPSSLSNCTYMLILDLSSNNLSGAIPYSFGQLDFLYILHLSNNQISGKLPSSFINLSFLKTLDLGHNRLSGEIPTWLGGFPSLSFLILRSNAFFGEIPSTLSRLRSLQVLDIAENNLSRNIPKSFGNITAMAQKKKMPGEKLYSMFKDNKYYQIELVVNAKNQSLKYTNTFFLVTCIDLSGNNLSGRFPEEMTKLSGLLILNLSRNHITGNIPESMSYMSQLSSLDLSSNQLTGSIPRSLSSLSFLGYLNLSHNNLSGAIPYTGHMTTFEASSFVGNHDLYGCPLPVRCLRHGDGHVVNGSNRGNSNDNEANDSDGFIDKWFYLSLGLGFAAGLLIPFLILAMKRSWSDAYFDFVEVVFVKFLVLMRRRRINLGRSIKPRRRQ